MGEARATSRASLSWHGGPNGLPSLPLAAGLVAFACLNLYVAWPTIVAVFDGSYAFDWTNFVEAGERFGTDALYTQEPPYAFRWSPAAAWALGFLTLMPLWLWQVLHVAALPLLGSWLLVGVVLASYPFWFDVQTGNLMTFVTLAGLLALRGSRVGTGAFLVLAVLVPRPLMLPLTVWLLWHRPATRLPFIAFFVVHAAAVIWLGYAVDWFAALTDVNAELVNAYNFGPSRFIGPLWIPLGLGFGVWLARRENLGFASLVISPYWLPYYFLMLVLELARVVEPHQARLRGEDREARRPDAGLSNQHAYGKQPDPTRGGQTQRGPDGEPHRQRSEHVEGGVVLGAGT
jgi:hypothetical protein